MQNKGTSPAVMRTESWANEANGRFKYDVKPGKGRNLGGNATGGVLDMPPKYDAFNFIDKTADTAPS